MSILVTIGTTSWRSGVTPTGSEVTFTGAFRYAADGSELMVWDAGLNNMRAMTDPEVAALPGQQATAKAIAAKSAATSSVDNGLLISGTQLDRLCRAVADVAIDEVNNLYSALPHPITGITRSGTVATATVPSGSGPANADAIFIFGATLAAYNGAVTVTGATAMTFTYTVAGSPVTPAVGTIMWAYAISAPIKQRTAAQLAAAIKAKISATPQ